MTDEIKKYLKDVENSIVVAPNYTINDIGCNQDSINKINSNFAKLNYSLLESVEVSEFQLIFKFKDGASSALDLPFDENTVIGIEVNDDESGYTITKLNGDEYDVPALYPNCVVLIELSEDQTKYIFTYADETTFEIPVSSGGGSTTYNLLTDVITNDSYIPVWTDNKNNHVIKTNLTEEENIINGVDTESFYQSGVWVDFNETIDGTAIGCLDFGDLSTDYLESTADSKILTVKKTGKYIVDGNLFDINTSGSGELGGIIVGAGILVNDQEYNAFYATNPPEDNVYVDNLELNLKEGDLIQYFIKFDESQLFENAYVEIISTTHTFDYQNFIIDESHLPASSGGGFGSPTSYDLINTEGTNVSQLKIYGSDSIRLVTLSIDQINLDDAFNREVNFGSYSWYKIANVINEKFIASATMNYRANKGSSEYRIVSTCSQIISNENGVFLTSPINEDMVNASAGIVVFNLTSCGYAEVTE